MAFIFLFSVHILSAQTNCQVAPCAADISGNGPHPCDAKLYCSNSVSVTNGLVACTPAADTDGCGVNASEEASELPGAAVDDFLDATLPNDCYHTGQYVQWIKYWLPVGINSLKIQGSGQLESWAVFHVPGKYTVGDLSTPCDLTDLVYYGACSNMNQWKVITNPESDPTYENLYLIALIYDEPSEGTINFKTKECESICFPRITCPKDATFECDDQAGIDAWFKSYKVDACNISKWYVDVTYDPNAFTGCDGTGSALITFTLKKGNTVLDYCTATLTIVDTKPPTIKCPADVTVTADAYCNFSYDGKPEASDNCDDYVTVSGPYDGDRVYASDCKTAGYLYKVKRTYTAEDDCHNKSSCSFYITVKDVTAPTITCPADVTLDADAYCNFTYDGKPEVKDNCDKYVSVTGPSDGDREYAANCATDGYLYKVKRTFTAEDDCGNKSSCSFYIYVKDVTPPSITCPADVTVNADAYCNFTYDKKPTASDNCDKWVTIGGPEDGAREYASDCKTAGYLYRVKRTYTATDDCGNKNSCSFYIYVKDVTPPAGYCPDLDVHVDCVEDIPCTIDPNSQVIQDIIAKIKAAFKDNCSEVVVTFDHATDLSDCEASEDGIYTVSRTVYFKVKDKCGNEATDSPCPVRFSAPCYNFCTYTQGYYGNAGGNNSHLALITSLMNKYGPIKIGLPGQSLTITSPECVIQFLPGGSTAQPLKSGDPVATYLSCNLGSNPTDGERLRNNLASNAIALQLNLWNNPGLGAVSLKSGCFSLPSIPGYNPATIQDLMNLVNQYLGGALGNSGSLGSALTNAVTSINEYWDECKSHYQDPCTQPLVIPTGNYMNEAPLSAEKALTIIPNPASDFATIQLEDYLDRQVTLAVYNNLGQLMTQQSVNWNDGTMVRLDLSGFNNGLYVAHVRVDNTQKVLRFVVARR